MALNDSATPDSANVSDLEHSLDTTYESMIEQLRVLYRDRGQMIELRDYPRAKFSGLVPIRPASPLGAPVGQLVMTEGRDWSLNGISVLSPQPFELESYLVIDFVIPGEVDHNVKMLCQVRRVHSDEQGHIIGCEFVATICK